MLIGFYVSKLLPHCSQMSSKNFTIIPPTMEGILDLIFKSLRLPDGNFQDFLKQVSELLGTQEGCRRLYSLLIKYIVDHPAAASVGRRPLLILRESIRNRYFGLGKRSRRQNEEYDLDLDQIKEPDDSVRGVKYARVDDSHQQITNENEIQGIINSLISGTDYESWMEAIASAEEKLFL